jgi:hypothetical protein
MSGFMLESLANRGTLAVSRELRSILVLAILLVIAAPSMQCLNVTVVGSELPIRLKQKARIKVLFDGQPLAAAEIVLTGYYARNITTLISNSDGNVTLPELPPGNYFLGSPSNTTRRLAICVIPCPDLGIETTVLTPTSLDGPLQVLDRDSLASSEASMEIGLPRDAGWARLIAAAEQQPATERVPEFRGVVEDQSGAIVPSASIDVIVKGTEGRRHAAFFRADSTGRFSAHLPEGDYVAVVSSPGFVVRAVTFTVISTGTAAELHVVLDVGSTTETITLSESTPLSSPVLDSIAIRRPA